MVDTCLFIINMKWLSKVVLELVKKRALACADTVMLEVFPSYNSITEWGKFFYYF